MKTEVVKEVMVLIQLFWFTTTSELLKISCSPISLVNLLYSTKEGSKPNATSSDDLACISCVY